MTDVLLLDIDSVLVYPRGYLVALQDTVSHYSRRMGVGNHPPTEAEVRSFEANGLGCEWDSSAACIALLLIERLCATPTLIDDVTAAAAGTVDPLSRWEAVLDVLASAPLGLPHPDYPALATRVGQRSGAGTEAALVTRDLLLQQFVDAGGHHPSADDAVDVLQDILDTLLGATDDVHQAPMTQHFQHLTLGSAGVTETYGIAPRLSASSYLSTYDEPLLTRQTKERIQEAVAMGQVRVALYTARPGLPPVDAPHGGDPAFALGYALEAELARSQAALEDYPVISKGKVRWLARRVDVRVEGLTKPSPVQALTAIGAALTGQEAPSVEAAWALASHGRLQAPLTWAGPLIIHVFEDTTGGIEAVQRAAALLTAAGQSVRWSAYGITPSTGPKAEAMRARGVPIFPTINAAIAEVLCSLP